MAGRSPTRVARTSRNTSGAHRPPTGALVASSAYYAGNVAPRVYGNDKGWQEECYRFYSIIGEARYAANYWGNALGKCSMFMEQPVVNETGTALAWEPAFQSQEQLALDDMFSGRNNQALALQAIGLHLNVGGECFVIGKYVGDPELFSQSTVGDNTMEWQVVPPTEMRHQGGGWAHIDPDTQVVYVFTERDSVIRLWRSDPNKRNQADSPFKSLMPVLREIEMLTEHIDSQLMSRLSGAGILWVPEGIDIPDMAMTGATEEEAREISSLSGPSKLMRYLGKIMSTAVKDRRSAAARVPIIIQAPDELIDKARIMHFWSDLDEKASEMRKDALHRFASGEDLPNESIEGMSSNNGTGGGSSNGVSHWGAWQIEESAIKMHIEPVMDVVVSAITIDWIRIQVPGSKMRVAYDATKLKVRPDRSEIAVVLYNLGELSGAALRRECSFDESDKPTAEERKEWLLLKMASGSNTPDQVGWAASQLGLRGIPMAAGPVANEARPAPSMEDVPSRPRTPERTAARQRLEVACNAMVLQALARVGNRLMNLKAGKVEPPTGTPTYAVHTLAVTTVDTDRVLADAFPMANEILCGIAEPAEVMPVLQRYTASLVVGKARHDTATMMTWLEGVETT